MRLGFWGVRGSIPTPGLGRPSSVHIPRRSNPGMVPVEAIVAGSHSGEIEGYPPQTSRSAVILGIVMVLVIMAGALAFLLFSGGEESAQNGESAESEATKNDGATADEREGVTKERPLLGFEEVHEGGLLRCRGLRLVRGGHW